MATQSAEERVVRDRQKYLESIPRYLKGDVSILPKYYPNYDTLSLALSAELPTVDKSKLNERIIALFEQHKKDGKLDKNKLNDYFVEALKTKNYPLVIWLAKEKDVYRCFLQITVNKIKECENNTNLQKCIQDIIDGLLNTFYFKNDRSCIEFILSIGVSSYNEYIFKNIAEKYIDDLSIIKLLIKNGYDMNDRVFNGSQLLAHAITNNSIDVVKYLLNNGVNLYDLTSFPPIYNAVIANNVEIVKIILERMAKDKGKAKIDNFIIDEASKIGNPSIIKLLIDAGANFNVPYEYILKIPLHVASENGKLDAVKILADKVKDINIGNGDKTTSLMFASKNGHLDVVKFLIEKGANVNLIDKYDKTALKYALYNNHVKVAEYLLSKGAKRVKLGDLSSPTIDSIQVLLNNGANIDERGRFNTTVLMYASSERNPEVVSFILSKGANVNNKNSYNKTALTFAVQNCFEHSKVDENFIKTVQLLIDAGIIVDETSLKHAKERCKNILYLLKK